MNKFKKYHLTKELQEVTEDISSFKIILTEDTPNFKLGDEVDIPKNLNQFFIKRNTNTIPDKKFNTIIREGKIGKDGKDGIAPTISIGELQYGLVPDVKNVGNNNDIMLEFTLPLSIPGKDGVDGKDGRDGIDGKDGKKGKDGLHGKDGLDGKNGIDGKYGRTGKKGLDGKNGIDGKDGKDGIDGKDGLNGVDGKDGKDGKNGKDGINGVDGKDGINGIDGKDGINGKDGIDGLNGVDGKDGKDGLNGKDGIDGKDGLNGKNGVDGKDGLNGVDGKSPTVNIGNVSSGEEFLVTNSGTDSDVILDFTLVKGDKGDIPNHELDGKGNIRFELPNNTWGEWINFRSLIENTVQNYTSKLNFGSGGGDVLDFVVGPNVVSNIRRINVDSESLIASVSGDTLTIGVNPNYVDNSGGVSADNITYTYDYYKLNADDIYDFILTFEPIENSETVILNGMVLTIGLDYTINNSVVSIDTRHTTKKFWNLTIKYAYES